MSKKRENIKTTKEEIIDYWIQLEDECDLNFDWAEADTICWRCGYERRLHRCHIIPDSLGGKDEPSNFVLLCADCHEQAPNVESSSFMWDWIKSYHAPFYNTFWDNQALKEYERIYHKSFIQELKERNIITYHAFLKFWKLKPGGTSYHFGHPYGNLATLVGKYKLNLDTFDAKYPNGKYTSDKYIAQEKDFEYFLSSFCELAFKYNLSVWEGSTRNPHSLCMNTFFPKVRKYHSISIKQKKDNYFMYIGTECNPNNIPVKSFVFNVGNCHKEILEIVENEIKRFLELYGTPENNHPYYFVANPYWSKHTQ
ncbi:MAG: HNH endonuclease [Clostridia bacterium]|nr:HNH endonuclease [Clostridia bacterium]